MTSNELFTLAERVARHTKWHWMPGMRTINGERVLRVDEDRLIVFDGLEEDHPPCYVLAASAVPDLADPATIGCLLSLVEVAYGLAVAVEPPNLMHRDWVASPQRGTFRLQRGRGSSRVAALVAALEVA